MKTFTIVYSNYTMQVFAWEGSPVENKKYLGNREVLGMVKSATSESALAKWRNDQE